MPCTCTTGRRPCGSLVGDDTPTILTIHNLAYQGQPVQTPAGHDLDDSWRSHGYLNLLHGAIRTRRW